MSQDSTSASRRFSDDLRQIREARGVDLSDVHDETKIPLDLLEEFEASGLVEHRMFNRVYLRSLVRTYAEMIDVDPERALARLDEALGGRYEGELVAEYVGGASPASAATGDDADSRAEEAEAEEAETDPAETAGAKTRAADAPKETAPDEDARASATAAGAAAGASEADRAQEAKEPAAEPAAEEESSTFEAATGSASPTTEPDRSSRSAKERIEATAANGRSSTLMWVGIVLGFLAVAAVVVVLAMGDGDEPATESATSSEQFAATDTAATQAEPEASTEPPSEPVTLPDTLRFRVLAADDKVDPIRIKVDDDLRRPYWLEQNADQTFAAANRIVFENPEDGRDLLSAVRIFVEGEPVPVNERDEQGRIVVDRERARTILQNN